MVVAIDLTFFAARLVPSRDRAIPAPVGDTTVSLLSVQRKANQAPQPVGALTR
jgi:hypothetical protein